MMSIKLLLIICIISLCNSELLIYKNELTEEVKTLAIGTAERLMLFKYNNSVVAQTLSDDFSKLYGGKWNCFVGLRDTIESILPQINSAPNTLLWFSYNTTHVLLFKALQSNCSSSYKEVIDESVNYNISFQRTTFNETMTAQILSFIKESLARTGNNCTNIVTWNWNSNNCYYNQAGYVKDKVYSNYGCHWMVIAGTLNSASWDTNSYTHYYEVVFSNSLEFMVHQNL